VIVNRDITERKRAEEQLAHNALHDAMTGLPNRRLFLDRLQRCFAEGQRYPAFRYAVLILNLDGFKVFNDTMGTAAGDQVLQEIARRLESCCRASDISGETGTKMPQGEIILCRLDGDEFGILLERVSHPSEAMRLANRFQSELSSPLTVNGREASIGIALSTASQEHAERLLRDANDAMRRAKAMGGSRSELFDTALHSRAVDRLKLENDLRAALDHNQFEILYQPIQHMESRRIVGFEALVRWQHPEQGLISPYKFMEAAEETGLMASIDKWVIWQACQQMCQWQSRYPFVKPLSVSVNISGRHLMNTHFFSEIKACLRNTGIEPTRLQLEISEATATANPDLTNTLLTQLNRLEVSTAIDDFGIVPVRLEDLRRFPVGTFKIDHSLVNNLLADRVSRDVVDLILTPAVTLGVETAAQYEHLRSLGCKFGQGYFFSQPLKAAQADELIREQSLSARHGAGREMKSP